MEGLNMANVTFGYARISRKTQNIERQIRNITEAFPQIDSKNIFQEAYTGRKIDRPQWQRLLKQVKPGDTIVFDSVSRMSRNAEDGVKQYFELYDKGVNLVFLREPTINTEQYKGVTQIAMTDTDADLILQGVNKYLVKLAENQIRAAFAQAQKEVDDNSNRTKGGIETARRNGKQIGQKPGATLTTKKSIAAKDIILKHNKSCGGTLDDRETAELAKISINSLYKYKRELRAEGTLVIRK